MKPPVAAFAFAALLAACTSPSRPQAAAGTTPLGVPKRPVSPAVLSRIAPEASLAADGVRLPERIRLPADYRLVVLDGHLTLVQAAPPAGAPAEGPPPGPAYQPALLPQELAAEFASARESAARMDLALEGVMQRSRDLADQTKRLEEQARALSSWIAAHPTAGSGSAPPVPPMNK